MCYPWVLTLCYERGKMGNFTKELHFFLNTRLYELKNGKKKIKNKKFLLLCEMQTWNKKEQFECHILTSMKTFLKSFYEKALVKTWGKEGKGVGQG